MDPDANISINRLRSASMPNLGGSELGTMEAKVMEGLLMCSYPYTLTCMSGAKAVKNPWSRLMQQRDRVFILSLDCRRLTHNDNGKSRDSTHAVPLSTFKNENSHATLMDNYLHSKPLYLMHSDVTRESRAMKAIARFLQQNPSAKNCSLLFHIEDIVEVKRAV